MRNWIRGVNLGGWLVLERWITPYLFALTTCHLDGHFCVYPGQLQTGILQGAPLCSELQQCKPVLVENPIYPHDLDYPVDEYTLLQQFQDNTVAARAYLEQHYDTFITRNNILTLHNHGVTHVRVPMPHWILSSSRNEKEKEEDEEEEEEEKEPWITDDAWLYFVRLVGWCREYGLKVIADLHTAPGSQNGFENSALLNGEGPTCSGWEDNPLNINRTLEALQEIAVSIKNDGLHDTVTGISILNEPYRDCEMSIVKDYNQRALGIVRNTLGNATTVIIGDLLNATLWNDGYWHDEPNTLLDSHYYHVFAEKTRALSPKQHIALTCRKSFRDVNQCCHSNTTTTSAMSRVVGEWSAAYDTLPVNKLDEIMKSIRNDGVALDFHRNLTVEEREFIKNFVKAQMVVYESETTGVSSGWFYWNIKVEGGAFAEWDFLRGVREGWIPKLPPRNVSSASAFGTCEHILSNTTDDKSIVHEYPDPEHSTTWPGPDLNDDLVISHGKSLDNSEGNDETAHSGEGKENAQSSSESEAEVDNGGLDSNNDTHTPSTDGEKSDDTTPSKESKKSGGGFVTLLFLGFFAYAIKRVFFSSEDRRRGLGYSSLHGSSGGEAVTMAV